MGADVATRPEGLIGRISGKVDLDTDSADDGIKSWDSDLTKSNNDRHQVVLYDRTDVEGVVEGMARCRSCVAS